MVNAEALSLSLSFLHIHFGIMKDESYVTDINIKSRRHTEDLRKFEYIYSEYSN